MDPIRNTLRSRGPDRYLHVFIGNLLPFQLLQDHHDLLGGESAIKILSPASHLLLTSHTSPHVWWLMCLLMLVVVLHDLMHLTFFGTWRWIFQQASFCLVLQFPKLCLDSRGMRRCPVKRPLQCTVHLHSSHNNLTKHVALWCAISIPQQHVCLLIWQYVGHIFGPSMLHMPSSLPLASSLPSSFQPGTTCEHSNMPPNACQTKPSRLWNSEPNKIQ